MWEGCRDVESRDPQIHIQSKKVQRTQKEERKEINVDYYDLEYRLFSFTECYSKM